MRAVELTNRLPGYLFREHGEDEIARVLGDEVELGLRAVVDSSAEPLAVAALRLSGARDGACAAVSRPVEAPDLVRQLDGNRPSRQSTGGLQ